jgi:hypothetical protein
MNEQELRTLMRSTVKEFIEAAHGNNHQVTEERKRREELEQRVNDLLQENQRSKAAAEKAERDAAVKEELQKLGVAKVDLAYRAVKDAIARTDAGELVARESGVEIGLRDYLTKFVQENPELLPARQISGSGTPTWANKSTLGSGLDFSKLNPSNGADEAAKARAEIARMAIQALRGQS